MRIISIEKIVEQALQDGYLTPAMEGEVGRICDNASDLSIEEISQLTPSTVFHPFMLLQKKALITSANVLKRNFKNLSLNK